MTASNDAAPSDTAAGLTHRYYLAMAVPFLIDVAGLLMYALLNRAPQVLLPSMIVSFAFLAVGVGAGAWALFRPIALFMAGNGRYADIERRIALLPRYSALVIAVLYAPMVGLRLLSHRLDITFGATLQKVAWPDVIANVTVGTAFNVVLTFFVVAAFLDRLCEYLFRTRGVSISNFPGRFSRKVALALLFVSFAAMILLAADIMSYTGARLVREATIDMSTAAIAAIFIYFWISRALTRPITRLDAGMRRVAENDYSVRLPVTSDDELGHAASRFNEMVGGLEEKEYLREAFGKYVSPSVATAILANRGRGGRANDATAEATLMFTDIAGFTTFSESVTPAEVADQLNAYLRIVVPVIEQHGGVVNSFIGDGLFASFNLPLPLPDHARAAIDAAIEIQRRLDVAQPNAGTKLRTRIGINTGTVIGLTIGDESRMSYTLLGDAVNVAARIEQLNKQFDTRILVAESTIRAANAFDLCECLGATDIRGHLGNVVVYRVDWAR